MFRDAETLVSGKHTRRRSLDGVRAIAILAVFASHTGYHALSAGWIGVEVFFVLSGYLITTLLLNEHSRNGKVALGRFYLRRVLRLYPALLVLLLLGVAFYATLGDGGTLGGYGRTAAAAGLYAEDFVAGITGQAHGGLGHTWSLAVEEQFYLLWPPILIAALTWGRRWLLAGVAAAFVASIVATQLLVHTHIVQAEYFMPWVQAAPLLAGCLLALLLHRGLIPGRVRTLPLAAVGLAGLAVTWAAAVHLGRGHQFSVQILACSAFSALLILGLTGESRAGRALGWRPIADLGLISYGFYLYFLVVLELVDTHVHSGTAIRNVLALVITLACAVLSYVLVEQWFLRVKDRIGVRVAATPEVPGGYSRGSQPAPGTASS